MSCGGILGFVGNLISGFFTGRAENKIANIINSIAGIGNKQTLFSVRKFMKGFLDSHLLAAVDSGKVLSTMDEIIMKTDLNSGLQLDIEIDDGVNNTISFVASQRAPALFNLEYYANKILVTVVQPAGASIVKIYEKSQYSLSWYYVKSTTGSGVFLPAYPKGAQLMAVAESSIILGLNSLPSNILTTNHNYNGGTGGGCGYPQCKIP